MGIVIKFEGVITLPEDCVFTEGVPENYTVDDVLKVMEKEGSKTTLIKEWNLEDDLIVTVRAKGKTKRFE